MKIRTPQGRREERKQKKDADLTTVYVLVWESVGSRGKNRAKPSCCYGLGFEARLNMQWREGRASGRGSGDRRRTAVAQPGRGPVDADGIARRPSTAPMKQPSLGIRIEREGAHASTGDRQQREAASASEGESESKYYYGGLKAGSIMRWRKRIVLFSSKKNSYSICYIDFFNTCMKY